MRKVTNAFPTPNCRYKFSMGTVLTDFAFTLNGRPVRVRDTAASVTPARFCALAGFDRAQKKDARKASAALVLSS